LKHKRLFSILAVAVVLSLLMIAIPATPVMATPIITLDVSKGEVGDRVTVNGTGFLASTVSPPSYHQVDVYFCSDFVEVGQELDYYQDHYEIVRQYFYTSDSGTLEKSFDVPTVLNDSSHSLDVHGGNYYVYVTYSDDEKVQAYAEFTVVGINEFSPDYGPVGTTVTISGVGFDANQGIIAKFDGSTLVITGGDSRFKNTGSFSSQVEIPAGISGDHTVTIADSSGHSDGFEFTIVPNIVLSPAQASENDEVTITGSGFPGNVAIFAYFNGDQIYITGDLDTDSWGSFESRFMVPNVDQGNYVVEVEDNSFDVATATLEVGAGLTVSPATTATNPGSVGDVVTVSGIGFKASTTITISYDSNSEPSTTSLPDGSFSYSLTIPPSTAGEHLITASDGDSSKTVTFFVESTPPVAPLLIAPAADGKASHATEFDWGDVTDDSLPISYELQVATSDQFTTESILVYKIGLTETSYTLTDTEKLEKTAEGTFYYWRVRAVDAASNTSPWTDGSAFTVNGGIQIKGWLLYVLIAVGAIAVFFLGVWVGRRSVPTEDYW
jgi:hypothetical protein